MDTAKTQEVTDRVYEDFEPYHESDRDEGRFTVMLPGKWNYINKLYYILY